MSAGRTCVPCRAAGTQCDLVRPTCGRCRQERLICSGSPLSGVFIFRNENEVAQRNSQRARRSQTRSPEATGSTSTSAVWQIQQPQRVTETDKSLHQHYSWLNERAIAEIPEPLKRDVETRAVERFFVDWTLHPSNNGVSSGYQNELPMLFYSSQSDSALRLAVQAVAFADVKNGNAGNMPFHIKARQTYGAALSGIRELINSQHDLGSDEVVSAMLLIDNFELMYLARDDPLGPHNEAIKLVLRNRGDQQLYSPTRFSLWRLTHFRLQAWQTLSRQHPDAQQTAWLSKLDTDRPDLRICTHVLHMNILSAVGKGLTQTIAHTDAMRIEKLNEAHQLAREMQTLLLEIESWTSQVTGAWRTRNVNPEDISYSQDVDEPPNLSFPEFSSSQLHSYDDLWLAYLWNFYASSQLVLRESLIEVAYYASTLQDEEPEDEITSVIQQQLHWINVLSEAILGSFPQLLGFVDRHNQIGKSRIPRQGKMAGKLFALFSMWAVQRAQFTSTEHKEKASEVIAWIHTRHGLG